MQNIFTITAIDRMFFYEGCKVIGQLPIDMISKASDFASNIDYKEDRFKRTEPALKYNNYLISVPPPITEGVAYVQKLDDLDFSSISTILDELKSWETFNNMTVFSCEISYLAPAESLIRHTDVRFYHLVGRRIQVPLLIDNAYFVSQERLFKLELPNVYEIDNITTHYAINPASTPKISLLIDFLDTKMLTTEYRLNRSPRRRVLWYNTIPENDAYK